MKHAASATLALTYLVLLISSCSGGNSAEALESSASDSTLAEPADSISTTSDENIVLEYAESIRDTLTISPEEYSKNCTGVLREEYASEMLESMNTRFFGPDLELIRIDMGTLELPASQFPDPTVLTDGIEVLTYTIILENALAKGSCSREQLEILLRYQARLVDELCPTYYAVIEYVNMHDRAYKWYEPGGMFAYSRIGSLCEMFDENMASETIIADAIETNYTTFCCFDFPAADDKAIYDQFNGSDLEGYIATIYMNRLSYQSSCKPNIGEAMECYPDSSLIPLLERLMKIYPGAVVKNYPDSLCPCYGC